MTLGPIQQLDFRLEQLIALATTIDQVKCQTIGFEGGTTHSNAIIAEVARRLALELPSDENITDALGHIVTRYRGGSDERTKWLWPKVEIFHGTYSDREQTHQYVQDLRRLLAGRNDPIAQAIQLLADHPNADGMSVRQLTEEVSLQMFQLQRYGLKPAAMQDGLLHPAQVSIVMMDPTDFQIDPARVAYSGDPALACLATANGVPTDLRITETTLLGQTVLHLPQGVAHGVLLRRDGHLDCGFTNLTRSPAAPVFEQYGATDLYDLLCLVHTLRCYDQFVPLLRVKEIPPWPTLGGRISPQEQLNQTISGLPNMVFPRIFLLRNEMHALPKMLEQEIEIAKQESDARTTPQAKRIIRHRVGHTRDMAPHRHPTPAAIQLALKERGIVLDPKGNTTYVREKKYPDDGKPVGVRGRRRPRTVDSKALTQQRKPSIKDGE